MNKTKIEWCDYTINPVKGLCPMHCKNLQGYEYCYAAGERGFYKRFGLNPEIRFEPKTLLDLATVPDGAKVFIGSTIELFGDWVKPEWMHEIFSMAKSKPRHTFVFLTKQPQNLIRWSPFPENCWVGVSATDDKMFTEAIVQLQQVKAQTKYISFEPLLGQIGLTHYLPLMLKDTIHLVIIGQQAPPTKKTAPKIEWLQEIIEACDMTKIPIFLKYNLVGFLPIEEPFYKQGEEGWAIRQEFPK